MDRKIELPDDVLRTKTFVLHPTSLEEATEQLEQVRRHALLQRPRSRCQTHGLLSFQGASVSCPV